MTSKMRNRFLAGTLAALLGFSSLGTSQMTFSAQETQSMEVAANVEYTTDTSEKVLYHFTPEKSGTYKFYSVESGDTVGCIYDAQKNVLYSDNDGGEDLNFCIQAELEANTDYYLEISHFQLDESGEVVWTIEESTVVEESDTATVVTEVETETTTETETATELVEGDYQYVIENDLVIITKFNGTTEVIQIPETIAGKTVSAIGDSAFECTGIKEVVIPKTVTEIQYGAFHACQSLEKVTFAEGSTLQKLGKFAFMYCTALKAIALPDSLVEAEASTFADCTALESVTLGAGLTALSDYMFSWTTSLKNITFPANIATIGRGTFSGSGLVELVLPDTIKEVGTAAFSSCESLAAVTLGNGIQGISDSMFANTSSLKNITFPANVTYIGRYAFQNSGLESVVIPDTVVSIEIYAFSNCKSLKTASIGNGLTYIAEGVFRNTGLENITIGNNVKKLDLFAFEKNASLKEVVIPNNVTEIEYAAFKSCTNLEKITIPSTLEKANGKTFHNTKWYENQADGDVYAGGVYYEYKGTMPENTTVVIKEGTLGIGGFAFTGQKNLVAVQIPYGVTNIGQLAFFDCSSLKEITIPSSVTEIWDGAIGYEEYIWGTSNGERVSLKTSYGTPASGIKIEGFTIIGDADSAAEAYAEKHGFTFKKNVYTVNFYDGDQLISTQEVTSGESAKAPTLTKEGFVLSWDTDFSDVKKDLNVKAVWKDYVEVTLPENNTIAKEAFAEILAQNETMDIVVKSNNDVTFTFGKGTMQAVEGKENYDFTTTIQNTYSENLPAYVKAETFVMVINYSYSGDLPAEASIRLLVGKDYAGKTLYYSWMKDDGTFAETQSAVADAEGYITVKQDHCSSYVVTTEAPTLPETDDSNNDKVPETGDDTNKKPSSPAGGDKDMSVIYILMFVSMFTAVVVFKKNKNIVR